MIPPDWRQAATDVIEKAQSKAKFDSWIDSEDLPMVIDAIESELSRAYTKGLLDSFTKQERESY